MSAKNVDRLPHRTLASRFRYFVRDRRGNVATMFAILAVPLLGAVGAAVDYSIAANTRTKIISALDAAVLLAVSKSEYSNDTNTAEADAEKMFNAQLALAGLTGGSVDINVTDGASGRTAVGSASVDVTTTFIKLLGFNTLNVSGTSTANVALPAYIDFYLLLDNTPSMGVAATPADIATMIGNTTDSCAFACHDESNPHNYYKLAKKLGVTTRIDVVRQATQKLTDTAKTTEQVKNQFRMALYTFGYGCDSAGLTTINSLTSSLSSVKSGANNVDLMTIPYQNYYSDQCTDFNAVLSAVDGVIPAPGPGTSSAPQKFLFFVSDGVADAYNPSSCQKPKSGPSRCQEPLNIASCTAMKARGVQIAVLYTTYLALPTNPWYNTWIAPFNAGPHGPSPNSEIAARMKDCATPGYYFEVSPTEGIAEAMEALFKKVVAQARLTH